MNDRASPNSPFDLAPVFEVDDYLFVYAGELSAERSQAEVDLWVRLLELESPLSILDLACGFGRHANRLAALGHAVTGVDLMPGFLEIARQEALHMGVQVDYRQGDMRQVSFSRQFDRVLLLFTSFGYFNDRDNQRVLENIARALKPGGLLGFDIPSREAVVKDLPVQDVIRKDGGQVTNRLSFDPLTCRMHNQRIVVRNGVRKDKAFSIRLYTPAEIRELLKQAGLETVNMLGYGGEPLTDQSRGMLIVARKPPA